MFKHDSDSRQIVVVRAAEHRLRHGILNSNRMLIEIPWYGNGNPIFAILLARTRRLYAEICPEQFSEDEKQ